MINPIFDPLRVDTHADSLGFERLVFFSDAVFAIAITLLAIEIRLPEVDISALPEALPALIPQIIAFVISFLWIGMFWVIHHRIFRLIKGFDNTLLWLNISLLLLIAFMPFPSSILGRYPGSRISVIIYATSAAVVGLLAFAIWRYASSRHRLIDPDLDPVFIRFAGYGLLNAPGFFLASIFIALFSPVAAIISWQLIWVGSALQGRAYARAVRRRVER